MPDLHPHGLQFIHIGGCNRFIGLIHTKPLPGPPADGSFRKENPGLIHRIAVVLLICEIDPVDTLTDLLGGDNRNKEQQDGSDATPHIISLLERLRHRNGVKREQVFLQKLEIFLLIHRFSVLILKGVQQVPRLVKIAP